MRGTKNGDEVYPNHDATSDSGGLLMDCKYM